MLYIAIIELANKYSYVCLFKFFIPWNIVVVLVAKSCLTLCNAMNCSLPGSSIHEISQARIPEWVVISSWPRDQTCVSCIARQIPYHWVTWEVHLEILLLHNYSDDYSTTLIKSGSGVHSWVGFFFFFLCVWL